MSNRTAYVIRKPGWLKIKLHRSENFSMVADIVRRHELHTICGSGRCPNMGECWDRGTATFMILGDICTRSCRFCATKTGKPAPVDHREPAKIAESVRLMQLKHCVITSVDRDDLPDGGVGHWTETVHAIREKNPDTTIETLIPDFDGRSDLLSLLAESSPHIIGHNIETVKRLTPAIRSRARYETSLSVMRYLSSRGVVTKSGLMAGIGETDEEILETLHDLKENGCRIVTIGQYLQPTGDHLPVDRYVHPDTFELYRQEALRMGFDHAESAPLVRSSYMADLAAVKSTIKTDLSEHK